MRMAKTQKATLDPSKISGRCGRLMCCLRYEDIGYEELRKKLPRKNTWVQTGTGVIGKVIDSQIITQLVRLLLMDNTQVVVPNEEIQTRDMPPPPMPKIEERVVRERKEKGPPRLLRDEFADKAAPPAPAPVASDWQAAGEGDELPSGQTVGDASTLADAGALPGGAEDSDIGGEGDDLAQASRLLDEQPLPAVQPGDGAQAPRANQPGGGQRRFDDRRNQNQPRRQQNQRAGGQNQGPRPQGQGGGGQQGGQQPQDGGGQGQGGGRRRRRRRGGRGGDRGDNQGGGFNPQGQRQQGQGPVRALAAWKCSPAGQPCSLGSAAARVPARAG